MMTNCGSLDREEAEFRKRALRDASLCIGWFKIMSVACYISMYYLVRFNSEGEIAFILELMLLIAMIPAVFLGLLLLVGTSKESATAISVALYTCIFLATYDLIIGLLGSAFIMIIADNVYHYVMTLAFVLLALTCVPAYCHDAFIINSYRKVLDEQNICCY